MGAHTALPTRTAGRIAGRGALTVAAALALTGGTASVAFAGDASTDAGHDTGSHSSACDCTWGHDQDRGDDGHDHGWKSDRDDDGGDWKSGWDDKDDDGWKSDKGDWKSGKDCPEDGDHYGRGHDHDGGKQVGARYDHSIHNGDDNYTVEHVTNTGILAGLL